MLAGCKLSVKLTGGHEIPGKLSDFMGKRACQNSQHEMVDGYRCLDTPFSTVQLFK
jgi:hypothetical protein